jgi:hypothetical protein
MMKFLCTLFLTFFIYFISLSTYASAHFTLRGTISENNLILRNQESHAASISTSFDMGTYFQIGITHRQATNNLEGYYLNESTKSYDYSEEKTVSIANSIDLTIILYDGTLFVPYIQIGFVKKHYTIKQSVNNGATEKESYSFPPAPNGGIGLSIRLNRNFSLDLSYTISPSIKQKEPSMKAESAIDSYSSIGVKYDL